MNGLISQFQLLGSAARFAEQNHRTISQNLANVNTPGYKAKELSFEELLNANDRNANEVEFAQKEVEGLEVRADGNNVDLDREMANLKKNSMAYQTLVQVMGSKIGIMNRAITG